MKKSILTFVSFLFLLSAFAQETDYSISEVVTVENKTANELYTSGKEWFAKAFKSANDVLQMDDAAAGKLIGKGSTKIREMLITTGIGGIAQEMKFDLSYTISIAVKDGRYKYEVNDIIVDSGQGQFPFSDYKGNRQMYVDGSTIEGAKALAAKEGFKTNNSAAKITSQVYAKTVILIDKADAEIASMIESLKTAMGKKTDDW